MSQQCIQLPKDTWFNLAEKKLGFLTLGIHFFRVAKTHLGRWIIGVADARTPGGEVKECEVPKIWSGGQTVLAGRRGQLPRAGVRAVAPITIHGPQVFLSF